MADEILTPEAARHVKEAFKRLDGPVELHVFTKPGVNEQFNNVLIQLVKEVSSLSPRIVYRLHNIGDPASKKYNVERSPTLLLSPDKYRIRYTGAPAGEEGRSFIIGVIMASTGRSFMEPGLLQKLKALNDKREVKVFVSPTCPYCPQQVLYALSAAVERPDMVSVEVIEIYENSDLAEKYGAMSVPKTYVNEELTGFSLQSEEEFVDSLVAGAAAEFVPRAAEAQRVDVLIAGAGPAGLTAAIYAGRSGLRAIVLEKANPGGQVAITPVVENYPGFLSVGGKSLVDMMMTQAAQYARIKQGVEVKDVRQTDSEFEVYTSGGVYMAKAIIIATGATYRRLNVPGEDQFAGRGISYCATCDGYLFKDERPVVVVGGGNTGVTDALYLDSLGARVTLVHRRDTLRAEEKLKQSLFQRNIPVLWNTVVERFTGDKALRKVRVKDLKEGTARELKADGAFIAVGYEPASGIARIMGLELIPGGYIKVDERQQTSVPRVYAAGDVTGGEKQITVAVSQGTVAAVSAFEDLTKTALV